MSGIHNWNTMTESKYPWERDALDFVRQNFPSHEPYRAWANFEFIADDGTINEVDLLLFTPQHGKGGEGVKLVRLYWRGSLFLLHGPA